MRTPARPEPIEDLMLQPAQTPQTPSDKQGQVLRVLLVLPALLALLGWLAFPNTSCRQGEIGQILRGLYLSVVLPPACGAFLPYATLKAWMRNHPFFCLVWTVWIMVMAAMFLLICRW